ncbi:MAG: hypothetical protein HY355_03700 [Armatimonadetes bacterium]|nr:hypothetical protein [Armatimonadota bacterium]
MSEHVAEDVARVLIALHDARAWFRHGLTDERLTEVSGLTIGAVVAARRQAESQGLIQRQGLGTKQAMTLLTPQGVARARALKAESADSEAPDGQVPADPEVPTNSSR